MKTYSLHLILILILAIVSVSFISRVKSETNPLLKTKTIAQVAIVVKDIDKARKTWAQALGIAAAEHAVTPDRDRAVAAHREHEALRLCSAACEAHVGHGEQALVVGAEAV